MEEEVVVVVEKEEEEKEGEGEGEEEEEDIRFHSTMNTIRPTNTTCLPYQSPA